MSDTHPIIFFDGVCNLCNSTVLFIIKKDRRKILRFAPLQSAAGADVLRRFEKAAPPDSVIVLFKDRLYTKSDAVLITAKLLGGSARLLLIGYLLPHFLRDKIYEWIARNRYYWFGKKDECMIPTPELESRFLS